MKHYVIKVYWWSLSVNPRFVSGCTTRSYVDSFELQPHYYTVGLDAVKAVPTATTQSVAMLHPD